MKIKVYKVYDSGVKEYEGEKPMLGWFFYDLKVWGLKVALYNLWWNISGKS